ncbi:EAL domain-containing protein [Planococcus sp. FY231025]|uniref:EAL domain-containing protein n=1 Tax=Planococcus sp. FY231025 TaxID=3455699 RepID=UPI003F92B08C
MELIFAAYNMPLVGLSLLVAIFSSFIALDISSRLVRAKGILKQRWILWGALVMGLGIWAMHFIGILAFRMPVEVSYHIPLVLFSVIPAVISCWLAFSLISRPVIFTKHLFFGASYIGMGILSMHFLGMKAMRTEAIITHNLSLWILAAVIAFSASFIALYLLFHLRKVAGFHWSKIASAILMGLAVSGMHYTGMSAVLFSPLADAPGDGFSVIDNELLAYRIGGAMLLILILAYQSVRSDKRITMQTADSERKFQAVFESTNDAIIVADGAGLIIQWNRGAEIIFGYSHDEVIGKNLQLIIPEENKQRHQTGLNRYVATREARVIGKTLELSALRKDGSEFPIELTLGSWQTEQGMFFSSIIRDISERKVAEEKISSLAYLDPLTGLPNRRLFSERLAAVLESSVQSQEPFSLLYMDLDHFKIVNDTFGHSVGDALLLEVTKRLKKLTAPEDTISRLGGDEFTFLLPKSDAKGAAYFATKVLDSFNEVFYFNGEELFVTPSIGICVYPADGADADTLIKHADLALYRVKDQGKNSFQFFTPAMNEETSRRSQIAIGIRKGLERGEFTIHYQPQFDIKTGTIIGAEALVRWMHPQMGAISPGEFISVAEDTGAIIQLGNFVLRNACLQNKAWQDKGLPPFRIAINISARQFSQTDICGSVSSALAESGLDARFLELELTESIIQGTSDAVETMQELKAMNIHLSIDDFGTGYSSLSYLKLFPIDTLKIDQYFTRNIHLDAKDAALVDTIIRMGHNLGLTVIAEGVETAEQLAFLKQHRCDYAQGYLFNRPLPPEEFEKIYCPVESSDGNS